MPPQRDECAVPGIQGVVLGNAITREKAILVREGRGFEAPVFLEVERTRSTLASSVIEHARATLTGAAHQFPILEVVRADIARGEGIAGVIGQNFVPEIEGQNAAYNVPVAIDDAENLAVIAEHPGELGEVRTRERRRSVT